MNETEYRAFVHDLYAGRILIGFDRGFARMVYTNMSISEIQRKTGEPAYLDKAVVLSVYIAQFFALLGASVLIGIALRWWAALIIPVSILIWGYNMSKSSMPGGSIWVHTFILIGAIIFHFANVISDPFISWAIVIFVFALWCGRFVYIASSFFLRAFILRNPRAFEAFSGAITMLSTNNGK